MKKTWTHPGNDARDILDTEKEISWRRTWTNLDKNLDKLGHDGGSRRAKSAVRRVVRERSGFLLALAIALWCGYRANSAVLISYVKSSMSDIYLRIIDNSVSSFVQILPQTIWAVHLERTV